MAARKMMVRETVIKLETIQTLFNKFFRKGRRFLHDCLDVWISPNARPFAGAKGDATFGRVSRTPQSILRFHLVTGRSHGDLRSDRGRGRETRAQQRIVPELPKAEAIERLVKG
jgi:hypothetical protein